VKYLIAIVAICIAVPALARVMAVPKISLYVPDPAYHGKPKDFGLEGMETVKVRTAEGLELEAWFQAPPDKGKVIVFFPGNAGNLSNRWGFAGSYVRHGYGVYMCEYPGYGGNPGTPSEQTLYAAGRAGLKWLGENGFKPKDLIILGESIGSGVAVQMALETPPAYMVLESAFTSIVDVMKYRHPDLPVETMFDDNKFDNLDKMARVKTHILFVHGEKDSLIPIRFAEKLFEAANAPKEFMTIKGSDHNDLYMYGAGDMLMEWLDKRVKEKNE
jgi:uncharacterized protein